MPDDIHKALLNSLFACLIFLEDAGDDIVDPDAAVRTMEDAAHPLLSLSDDDRRSLVAMIRQLAAEESDDGWWGDFIRRQPFAMGLVDHDEPR